MAEEKYNNRVLKNKHGYQNIQLPNRKDFVVSFITGAIIGSALGLFYKNKVYQKTDELIAKEQEIAKKVKETKTQFESSVESAKDKFETILHKKQNEQAELTAQQRAIKEEVATNNLSDTSEQAQEIQQAKKEATSKEDKTADETAAQQRAIKEEVATNNLSDTSEQAQEIQQAKKEATSKEVTTDETAAQQRAIKEEVTANNLSDTSKKAQEKQYNNQEQPITEVSSAEKLANAAKNKRAKLTKGSKESQLTDKLLKEQPVAKSQMKEVPNLVTKKNVSKNSKQTTISPKAQKKVQQKETTFDNGVVTTDTTTTKQTQTNNQNTTNKKSTTKQKSTTKKSTTTKKTSTNTKPKTTKVANSKKAETEKTTKASAKPKKTKQTNNKATTSSTKQNKDDSTKVETAKSKIEKRTFND
ncbi:coiled-coil domain-containing protein [Staphylococcus simiae]|uniref:Maebl n=1 Tax=Staphylococcus simiae CCM 7213 = CCUG 51256 TaxID=911238 RepID=G5JHS9_9STAP|nr:hypothetical protein [Staphylococcus simiae]EHJ08265.1 hypothetical protein SS7213T_05056 [Staphylococcus simiae CCM 7213 = CCUG 51256]PNZ10528.1 hypothetical protein CD113_10130 [Staphylococcus simiae]SNV74764.1 smooth muscle caldesmon [Staphylococcus simiae]